MYLKSEQDQETVRQIRQGIMRKMLETRFQMWLEKQELAAYFVA